MTWRVGWSLAAGIVVGVIAAWWVTSVVQPALFETSPHDLRIYTAAATVLLVSAMPGTAVPVWRALHVDPMLVLRRAKVAEKEDADVESTAAEWNSAGGDRSSRSPEWFPARDERSSPSPA